MNLGPGKIEIAFTIASTPENEAFFAAMLARAEREWPVTLARMQEQSRLSGLDIIYDLTMFEAPWSPVYRHGSDQPVAWVNSNSERREGAEHPEGWTWRAA